MTMRSAITMLVILLLVATGWWLYRSGFDSGFDSRQSEVEALQRVAYTLQFELELVTEQAEKDAAEQARLAEQAQIQMAAAKAAITDELQTWMKKYAENVGQCAVAQLELCPSLQDY